MKLKIVLGVAALGLVGYGIYRYFFLSSATSELEPLVQGTNPDLLTQPSQVTPYQNIVAPRVDNANQPWYNNGFDFEKEQGSGSAFDVDLFTLH